MSVDIGVILPTSTPDPSRPILGDVRASARFAEEVGLDSIWATDHVLPSAPMLESAVVLATAAAVTDRIAIGFSALLLALRPVAWSAKHISTLQYVSGDRLILGVGTGNPVHGDLGWRAVGASFEERGSRTDEALEVLPGLVIGNPTRLGDDLEVALAPGATMPPILIAGNGRAALRRAARFGDGWTSMALAPDEIVAGLAEIDRLAAGFGRPPVKATVVGPALSAVVDEAADQVRAYEKAGVERIVLAPSGEDWRSGYEFAAGVRASLS